MKKWDQYYTRSLQKLAHKFIRNTANFNHKYYLLISNLMSHKISQSHKVLHQNNIGKVTKCNCCEKLQVLIGTTLMTLNQEDFESCLSSLSDLAYDLKRKNHIQTIYLRTPSNAVYITLSQHQFLDTIDLLKGASLMLEINGILL